MSDSAISDFMNITGCSDHSRAKFYIDSANGDIDAAVISFFESAGDEPVSYFFHLISNNLLIFIFKCMYCSIVYLVDVQVYKKRFF